MKSYSVKRFCDIFHLMQEFEGQEKLSGENHNYKHVQTEDDKQT